MPQSIEDILLEMGAAAKIKQKSLKGLVRYMLREPSSIFMPAEIHLQHVVSSDVLDCESIEPHTHPPSTAPDGPFCSPFRPNQRYLAMYYVTIPINARQWVPPKKFINHLANVKSEPRINEVS